MAMKRSYGLVRCLNIQLDLTMNGTGGKDSKERGVQKSPVVIIGYTMRCVSLLE